MQNITLESLSKRIAKLEAIVLENKSQLKQSQKSITLAEIARRDTLKKANGQQKVAAIVGYYEKVKGELANREEIKNGWSKGKFLGRYHSTLVDRAVGDFVRDLDDGTYDLTQKGEDFFGEIVEGK